MQNNLMTYLTLNKEELNLYNEIFMRAKFNDTEKSPEVLSGVVASKLMLLSRLEKDDLSRIWKMSTKSGATISKQEFFLSLKLIALLQNGLEITPQNLARFTFYPKLDDGSSPIHKVPVNLPVTPSPFNEPVMKPANSEFADLQISDENLKRIETYIETKCRTKQKGVLSRAESIELLKIGGFNSTETNQLWEAFDTEKKEALNRGQLIALLFYISLRKNKQPVPFFVPPKIAKFIREYNEKQGQSDSNRNTIQQNAPAPQNPSKSSVDIEELNSVIRKITAAVKVSETNFKQEKQKQESLVASFANQILRLSSANQGFETLNKLIMEQISVVDECLSIASSDISDKVDQKNQYEMKLLSLVSKQKETFDEKMKVINSGIQKAVSINRECENVISRINKAESQVKTKIDSKSPNPPQETQSVSKLKDSEEFNDEFQKDHAKISNGMESNKSIQKENSRKHSNNSQEKAKSDREKAQSRTSEEKPLTKSPESSDSNPAKNESNDKKPEEEVTHKDDSELQESGLKQEINTSLNAPEGEKEGSPIGKNGSRSLFDAGNMKMKNSGIFTTLLMKESMLIETENKKSVEKIESEESHAKKNDTIEEKHD